LFHSDEKTFQNGNRVGDIVHNPLTHEDGRIARVLNGSEVRPKESLDQSVDELAYIVSLSDGERWSWKEAIWFQSELNPNVSAASKEIPPICWVCEETIEIKAVRIDGSGRPVHEVCQASKFVVVNTVTHGQFHENAGNRNEESANG